MDYLIVEDNFGGVISLLKGVLESEFKYKVHVMYMNDAAALNREKKPEIVQFDGLGGECVRLHDEFIKENPEAEYLVFSAHSRSRVIRDIRSRGMEYFKKTEMKKLLAHVKNLQE